MGKEDIYGCNPKQHRYDLLEAIMICLGREEEAAQGSRLHGLLATLLSDTLSPGEKEYILEREYDIETTVEMEGGTRRMCNLSERIEERGIKKGREEGRLLTICNLVSKGMLKKEDAAMELGMTMDEFADVLRSFEEEY